MKIHRTSIGRQYDGAKLDKTFMQLFKISYSQYNTTNATPVRDVHRGF